MAADFNTRDASSSAIASTANAVLFACSVFGNGGERVP